MGLVCGRTPLVTKMFPNSMRTARSGSFYVLLAFLLFDICDSSRILQARETGKPSPMSVPPTQNWEGNDGPWSTFAFSIGTPAQLVRLLIGTSASQTWVVAKEGCGSGDSTTCAEERGTLWERNNSMTYVPNTANVTTDIYTLDLEAHLGYVGKGRYGFDTVQLGWQKDGVGVLKNQTVVGIATKSYFLGIFGLDPRTSSFKGDEKPVQSYMANLKTQRVIPSVSWAYSAGNTYRSTKIAGSLTLGGYDSSKFTPNSMSFSMIDEERDLMTPIRMITTNSGKTNLLASSISAYLDSAIPFMYLPVEACKLFEDEFKLTWNETLSLYVVPETTHVLLLAKNPSITFSIGNASQSVDIVFPYAAFDLTAGYPYVDDLTTKVRYFPLRRALNSTQYVLGRTFFQEAYVIADYERRNFSISQSKFDVRATENLVAILPLGGDSTSPQKTAPVGVIAGAVAGALVIGLVLLYFFWWRPRQRRKRPSELDSTSLYHPLHPNSHQKDPSYIKAELDAGEDTQSHQQQQYGKPVELSETAEIYEMPANEMTYELASLPPKDERRGNRLWGRGQAFDVSRQNTTDTLGFPRTPIGSLGISGESSIQTTPAANYALPSRSPKRKESSMLGTAYHDRRTPSPSLESHSAGVSPMRMDSTADSMGFPQTPGSATLSSAGNSLRFPLNSREGSQRDSPVISPTSAAGSSRYRRF